MLYEDTCLAHFGIHGQRWGIRRFQNKDGSLTPEGKERYASSDKQPRVSRFEKMMYPEKLWGKSKEEKKAWEKAEEEKYKKQNEKDKIELKFEKNVSNFDKLSEDEKRDVGDEILKRVSKKEETHDERKINDGLRDWLFQQIDKKSGNWNTGDSVSEGHKKVMRKMAEIIGRSDEAEEKVKKEIGYKSIPFDPVLDSNNYPAIQAVRHHMRQTEAKRLNEALNKDSAYKAAKEAYKQAEQDLVGTVLKDLGFSDTPENRSMIYRYVIYD